jgi:hypothetical protein
MMRTRLFGAAFFVCASVSAMMCNVEDDSSTAVQAGETIASQIFSGRVVDANNAPIVGARVTINGIARLTGTTGQYTVSVADSQSGYNIDIRKNGYGPQTQTQPSGVQNQTHRLVSGTTTQLASTGGGLARDPSGIVVSIPPNAFRTASGAYNGTVRFTIIPHSAQTMPGDFTARNAMGRNVALISIGAVTLQATDTAGNTLGLSSSLTVNLPVPASAGGTMPACVLSGACRTAMWVYNPTTRLWEERGASPAFTNTATTFTIRAQDGGSIDPDNGIGTWNADIEKTNPACTLVEFSNIPLTCYNPFGATPEPGIDVTFNLPGPPVMTVTRNVRSSAAFIVIYNIPANVPMTLSFAFPPGAPASCAASLLLGSTPAPISTGPGSITFDTGAPWGGTGLPPDPFTQCNSNVMAAM